MRRLVLILVAVLFLVPSITGQNLQEYIANERQRKIEARKQAAKVQNDSLYEVHLIMQKGLQVNNNTQLKTTLSGNRVLDSLVSPESKTIFHFDDGRLVERIKYDYLNGDDRREVTEYDNNNSEISFATYAWNDTLQQWIGDTKTESDYYSNSDLSSYRYHTWSTNLGDWNLREQKDYDENRNVTLDVRINDPDSGYRKETTYNTNSQLTLCTSYELQNTEWIPETEVSYNYDNDQINLRRNYEWENSQWSLQTESTYEHTISGNSSTTLIHTRDDAGTFLSSTLIEKTYNADNQLLSSYTYRSFTYPTPQWEEYEWVECTYTINGLLESRTSLSDYYGDTFYSKQEYTYTSSDLIKTKFSYYKFSENNDWETDVSRHYEYDSEGRRTFYQVNFYDFGNTIGWSDRYQYSYDTNGNPTLRVYETKTQSWWNTEWKYEYQYDQYNNRTELVYTAWDGLRHKYDYTFDYTLDPSQIAHLDNGHMRVDYTKWYWNQFGGGWNMGHQGIYYYSEVFYDCPVGNVTFRTQQEIDDFPINYPTCTEIAGNLYIGSTSQELSILNDLSPLSQLTTIQGKLTIIKNGMLTNLNGLENLTTMNGDIYIGSNPALSSLADWNNLTSTGGRLIIRNNALNDLNGFNSLTSIAGYINIGPDTLLTSLAGLENLISINGYIHIHDNTALNSLNGLDNIDHTTITNLRILDNPQLNVCNVPSICSYLENDGIATISNNDPGCNSEAEVETACFVTISSPEAALIISFSPNPNFGKFEVRGITQGTYQIYDTKGRTIQSGELENDILIDISPESQGVYFISFFIDNQVYTEKIIKM